VLTDLPCVRLTQHQTIIQVQDHTTLLESLVSLLSPEELVGDNQYDCAFCAGKRDATRQMVLRRLPPFLSLSLQRFVFDQRVRRG
jgi:ubiquitin C-terminal hydrolase